MLTILAIGFLGWLAGVLVNYLSDILPAKRRLARPVCFQCEVEQDWRNYLFFPRRCPACGISRQMRTWVVEILYIFSTIWLWLSPPTRLGFPVGLILLVYFGVIVIIDIEHRLILHPVSLAGAFLGLAVGTWLNGFPRTLVGGIAGFCFMLLLYFLGAIFVRVMAARRGGAPSEEALGFGDVNLAGVLGLILGWPGIMAGQMITILLAGAASLIYLLVMIFFRKFHANLTIPYGPFLIAGAVLLLFFSGFVSTRLGLLLTGNG